MKGSYGNDVLHAGAGIDVLVGKGGNDTFILGAGDFAKAGTGADTFVFAADFTGKGIISGDENSDVHGVDIFTFSGGDHIDISLAFGIDNAADLLADAENTDRGVCIELGNSAEIEIRADVQDGGSLRAITVADLQAWTDLFHFVG